jgi:hypothetical protein
MTLTDSPSQIDNSVSSDKVEVLQVKTGHKLTSRQPRFYIPEIQARFKHTSDISCYKVKVSFPWIDHSTPPTYDNYHKVISLFYSLVHMHDKRFEILPWDLRHFPDGSINNLTSIPTSHDKLKMFIYNLQLSKTRVRFSCVITTTYDFTKTFKQKQGRYEDKPSILSKFQKQAIWIHKMDIQTMGNLKSIGYLQLIHPTLTNAKQLLIDIQSIVETRDISLEIFRPRAIDENGHLLRTTEAYSISTPSDISVKMYESLVDKWSDIRNGYYDDVIGVHSILKQSYFVPSAKGLFPREVRNKYIEGQFQYIRKHTGVQINRCNTVDNKFKLNATESKELGLQYSKDKGDTTIREILMSRKSTTGSAIIQTIQQATTNAVVLIVDKHFLNMIMDEVSILLDILNKRTDYNSICGTSDPYGPSLDSTKLTKKSQNYLSGLQATIMTIEENTTMPNVAITPSKGTNTKRKDVHSTYNIPPRFKRNNLQNLNNSDDSDFSSPERSNETKPKLRPPVSTPIKKTRPIRPQTTRPQIQSPSYKDAVLVSNTEPKTPTTFVTATTAKNLLSSSSVRKTNHNAQKQLTTIAPMPHLVPLTQPPPTAISTTSTLTPNTSATNLCTKYMNDKVGQITRMFSSKYDNALTNLESKYQKKFEQLVSANNDKLSKIDSKIDKVQETCTQDIQEVRNECLNFHSQFKEQNVMLSSLKELIVNRNKEDSTKIKQPHLKKRREKKKKKDSKKKRREKHYEIMNYEASDDNDISYTDSEHLDRDSTSLDDKDHIIESTDQSLVTTTDSNSMATQSSNSVHSEQTRHTHFSTSNSTQSTMPMSSVASMISDTRENRPIANHRQESEWTVVRPNKNNSPTKIREAGLVRLTSTTQHSRKQQSSKSNRFDPDGSLQHSTQEPLLQSTASDITSTASNDLCTSPALHLQSNGVCEDRVT